MIDKDDHIGDSQQIIISLGLPRAQQNERSALCQLFQIEQLWRDIFLKSLGKQRCG